MKELSGWLLQRITGLLLVAGLVVHFTVMHFSGSEEVTYDFVRRRISSPYWRAFDIAFLCTVIYHGFNGLRGLAVEYVASERLLRVAHGVLLSVACLLVVTGVYIVLL